MTPKTPIVNAALVGAALAVSACGSAPDKAEVVEQYAAIVHANYSESLTTAQSLKAALDTFAATPNAANLEAAKQAWLAARRPYGQTEAFRFSGGPIDAADGPEGQINAWPLDEVYIDMVEGSTNSGLINDTSIMITTHIILAPRHSGASCR